jgi:diaminohydroxyphosphoribosylaminopyrimidine deaminase/5-amino-6-(5-phosphoribosylamino)uracil reductase
MTASAADRAHMARALELAGRGRYSAPPNPAVGCVITRDGAAIAEGWHERVGGPHAEVVALRAVPGGSARGGTAYVTLEPCSHHGRTPPCADALIEAGVARVVCAMRDPNPRVNGQGIEQLRSHGIDVATGLLEREARELNRGFVSRMERGRPWVTIKIAASADGRTALANGASQWITGEAARADVQRLRAQSSAVLTGIGTVLADDPRLTVRDPQYLQYRRPPLRVVLDSRLRTPRAARVLGADAPTLVFCADAGAASADELRSRGVTVEQVPAPGGRTDLGAVLDRLAAIECNEVLVEAGSELAGAFVDRLLADELVIYLAPALLGPQARPMLELPEPGQLPGRGHWRWHEARELGGDLRLILRPEGAAVEKH